MYKPLYLADDPSAAIAAYTPAQRAVFDEFADQGYVVIDLEIPKFEVLAAATIADLATSYDASGRIQDAWRRSAHVRRIATDAPVMASLKLLYGRDAFPFQTLNFDRGTEQATHSDTVHFDSSPPGFMAGVWVALEDIDANNGPLHYFPGTHKLPHLTLADAGVLGSQGRGYDLYDSHYVPMIRDFTERGGFERREASMRRGQALIWAANLLHGGSPIREPGRSRHSQVTHYYFNGCTYFTPLYSDPHIGRVKRRYPIDIRSDVHVDNSYLGLPLATPAPVKARKWLNRRLRGVTPPPAQP